MCLGSGLEGISQLSGAVGREGRQGRQTWHRLFIKWTRKQSKAVGRDCVLVLMSLSFSQAPLPKRSTVPQNGATCWGRSVHNPSLWLTFQIKSITPPVTGSKCRQREAPRRLASSLWGRNAWIISTNTDSRDSEVNTRNLNDIRHLPHRWKLFFAKKSPDFA